MLLVIVVGGGDALDEVLRISRVGQTLVVRVVESDQLVVGEPPRVLVDDVVDNTGGHVVDSPEDGSGQGSRLEERHLDLYLVVILSCIRKVRERKSGSMRGMNWLVWRQATISQNCPANPGGQTQVPNLGVP